MNLSQKSFDCVREFEKNWPKLATVSEKCFIADISANGHDMADRIEYSDCRSIAFSEVQ
jgi:hypothetical protein